MAAPGTRGARYEQLAGPLDQRLELYYARKHLGFDIGEWQTMPWWWRRVYVEGWQHEADERERDASGANDRTGLAGIDAIYGGSMADVRATTSYKAG